MSTLPPSPSATSSPVDEKPKTSFLSGLAGFGRRALVGVVGFARANPVIAINATTSIVNGVAGLLPAAIGGPLRGSIATISTAALRNAVQPAKPADSQVQERLSGVAAALQRAGGRR